MRSDHGATADNAPLEIHAEVKLPLLLLLRRPYQQSASRAGRLLLRPIAVLAGARLHGRRGKRYRLSLGLELGRWVEHLELAAGGCDHPSCHALPRIARRHCRGELVAGRISYLRWRPATRSGMWRWTARRRGRVEMRGARVRVRAAPCPVSATLLLGRSGQR